MAKVGDALDHISVRTLVVGIVLGALVATLAIAIYAGKTTEKITSKADESSRGSYTFYTANVSGTGNQIYKRTVGWHKEPYICNENEGWKKEFEFIEGFFDGEIDNSVIGSTSDYPVSESAERFEPIQLVVLKTVNETKVVQGFTLEYLEVKNVLKTTWYLAADVDPDNTRWYEFNNGQGPAGAPSRVLGDDQVSVLADQGVEEARGVLCTRKKELKEIESTPSINPF